MEIFEFQHGVAKDSTSNIVDKLLGRNWLVRAESRVRIERASRHWGDAGKCWKHFQQCWNGNTTSKGAQLIEDLIINQFTLPWVSAPAKRHGQTSSSSFWVDYTTVHPAAKSIRN